MANGVNHRLARSAKSGRFEALLEKLAAVQIDLNPVFEIGNNSAQTVASVETIADACDVLRSAIADMRNIIYEANGLTVTPERIYG